MRVQVAYYRRPDEPQYMEQLLTDKQDQVKPSVKWATSQGYVVRVAEIDLSTPPDFAKTLNRL